jgi:hypothetical protein
MPNDLLRDLLIVNRRFFDEAVATVRAQANHDIDCTLRAASLWAYREANRRPKDELQQVNSEAQERAERTVAGIQTAAAEKIEILKSVLHERERSIREHCDRRAQPCRASHRAVASPDQRLTCIHAPLPPDLAEVFGYAGQARFVAFYHEPTVDQFIVDDGAESTTGQWYAFEQWRHHPAVASHLQDFNLGDADLDAAHWLIIDRSCGELYVTHVSTALVFLQDQHGSPPEIQPNQMAEIHRRSDMQQRAVARMLAFLDQATDDAPVADRPSSFEPH